MARLTAEERELALGHGKINAIYYWDNVLWKHVIPFFHQHQDMHIFQQDNARMHTVRVTTQYLSNNNIPLLE